MQSISVERNHVYRKMMDWIVVVSAREARILERSHGNTLHQIELLKNPIGRLHNRELTTDRPGLSRAKYFFSFFPHALQKEDSPHLNATRTFAKEVADHLRSRVLSGVVRQLTIVAEPRLLGFLRSQMAKHPVRVRDLKWVSEDLQNVSIEHLEEKFLKN